MRQTTIKRDGSFIFYSNLKHGKKNLFENKKKQF